MIQVPEIMAELNSKQKEEIGASQKQITARMDQAKAFYNDPFLIAPGLRRATGSSINRDKIWKQHLAKNPLVLKKFVPDNDSQLLNQLNQNERLLTKLKKQNQDIQNEITKQNKSLEYLEGRENNRQVRERLKIFGNFLLNLRL